MYFQPEDGHFFKLTFCTTFKLFENDPFLKPFGKSPRIRSTGLDWFPAFINSIQSPSFTKMECYATH